MPGTFRKQYVRFIRRELIFTLPVVILVVLYGLQLMSLNAYQVKVLVITVAVITPVFLLIGDGILRVILSPAKKVLNVIDKGGEPASSELERAEKRLLLFHYVSFFNSIWMFGLGGAIVGLTMVKVADSSVFIAYYFLVIALTGGVVEGMGLFYLGRAPLWEMRRAIMARLDMEKEKPPVFVSISVKLAVSFVLVILLVMVFSSLLTYKNFTDVLKLQNRKLQEKELLTMGAVLEGAAKGKTDLKNLLETASSPDKTFCMLDKNFNIQYCPGEHPPPAVLEKLAEKSAGKMVKDPETGWSWGWTYSANRMDRMVSGWAAPGTAVIREQMKGGYIKVFLIALAGGIILGVFVSTDISGSLKELSAASVKISQGATEAEVVAGSEDETGIVARAFNRMTTSLLAKLRGELDKSKSMVESITGAVQTLAPMSKQLVSIASQQASGSVEQASAAEEAATTSQEIVAVSKQIAENAKSVSDNAESTLQTTRDGQQRLNMTREQFDDINKKMDDIANVVLKLGEQSQEIGDIIKIIDEISEQTNLLALNASIEAVGAGEQGKRFGVVAQEIRRLANNTAESTRKIQDIVTRMQNSVSSSIMHAEDGNKSVDSGKNTMEEMAGMFGSMVEAINESTPRLKEITMMTSQQSSASEQMAKTVEEVRVTAHESSSAASQLQSSISELEEIVTQLQSYVEEEKVQEIEELKQAAEQQKQERETGTGEKEEIADQKQQASPETGKGYTED